MRTIGGILALLLLVSLSPAQQPAPDELKPGLLAEFFKFDQGMEEFPTLPAERKPDLRRIDKQVNYDQTTEGFAGTSISDHFYVRWTGVLRIAKDGKYTFFTESDDGSRLTIDGRRVVDNGGLHAMEEKSGDLELKAGDHDIRIELFENDGEVGCKVSWEADGLAKELLPEKVLLHKKDKDLDKDLDK